MNTVTSLKTVTKNVSSLVEAALQDTGGLLRLAPNWVPRSFLQPGLRIKLHPDDTYAYGANRGGIDERWFASTTEAANEGRVPDEGLSYCVVGKRALHAAPGRRRLRRRHRRQGHLEEVWQVAGLFEVLRQHGADSPAHAPERQAGQARRPGRQARVLLLPAAA